MLNNKKIKGGNLFGNNISYNDVLKFDNNIEYNAYNTNNINYELSNFGNNMKGGGSNITKTISTIVKISSESYFKNKKSILKELIKNHKNKNKTMKGGSSYIPSFNSPNSNDEFNETPRQYHSYSSSSFINQ
tara:strand:- start:6625 stop:7020 length:396 start_codon:yes stop_codon:yes gene_type:complete